MTDRTKEIIVEIAIDVDARALKCRELAATCEPWEASWKAIFELAASDADEAARLIRGILK